MSAWFKKPIFFLLIVLPLCGVWQIGLGAYIHAKAILAQLLLETAWSETIRTSKEVKPWPWADTWPVGRLTVPALGISRIVLAGASGSSLAFGPGHLFGSAIPGNTGNIVIAGHRDTNFRFLQELKPGDEIRLQADNGATDSYSVCDIRIVTRDDYGYLDPSGTSMLTLITCYPFDAIRPGGPLRYVVIARKKCSEHNILI